MKNHEMSSIVKEALRNMPIHWNNERERTDYIIAHAECFITRYKTNKTDLSEEWPNIEVARKAAVFTAAVGARIGKTSPGISIHAKLDVYEALVETCKVHKNTKIKMKEVANER
jgi:hypothetical protein